ncbi:UxaA family hydrolase [Pectobacterium parmentieri]|uniref:UxaA family hydrolase n=1 Tax=Pectobacterium parmentieri TaxID=1905730 RepID=UPI003075BE1A
MDGVVALNHLYGCGVANQCPCRSGSHSHHSQSGTEGGPNFGGEILVVGLGCEKLQPERLLEGTPACNKGISPRMTKQLLFGTAM